MGGICQLLMSLKVSKYSQGFTYDALTLARHVGWLCLVMEGYLVDVVVELLRLMWNRAVSTLLVVCLGYQIQQQLQGPGTVNLFIQTRLQSRPASQLFLHAQKSHSSQSTIIAPLCLRRLRT